MPDIVAGRCCYGSGDANTAIVWAWKGAQKGLRGFQRRVTGESTITLVQCSIVFQLSILYELMD